MGNGIRNIGLVILTVLMAGGSFFCTKTIAGAGSETTNGITGHVRDAQGTPAVASIVKLLPSNFNMNGDDTIPESWIDTTDEQGRYFFPGVEVGVYNVIMRNTVRSTGCKIDSIVFTEDDTLLAVPVGTLQSTGKLLILLDDQYRNGPNTVYIPGTDISVVADDTVAELVGVPEGVVGAVFIAPEHGAPVPLRASVAVEVGKTVTIVNSSWRFERTVIINTTSEGVPLATPQYRFAALLRLTSENFTFDEAKSDGSDILFSGPDNSPVPFEIARWDPARQQADLWLLIDTLHPDTTIRLSMFWGNGDAEARSVSTAVFDTAAGYQGIWHLEQGAVDTVHDATPNRYDGVIISSTSVTFSDGVVGLGCRFDGVAGYIQMPGTAESKLTFAEDGEYTVSAWVYVPEADDQSHVVLSKGNYHYFIFYSSIHTHSPLWEFSEYQSGSGWDLSATAVESGDWHLLTGVRNGTTQMLYYDGHLVDSTGFTYDAVVPANRTYDLVIGRFLQDFGGNDYCFFEGVIDEVRIENTVRSGDWIRLCFENQKADNALVYFEEP